SALCSYCHFARTDRHDADLRRRWAQAVIREFDLRRRACPALADLGAELATVYVGGGTPSVLEPALFQRVMSRVIDRLPRDDAAEITVEANPESFDDPVADAWRDAGVGRVSLGVQSLDQGVLALLGRRCDPATARRALALACRRFDRVSADWILGPGLTLATVCAELDEAIGTGVEHVSLYILELHEGTPLARAVVAGELVLPADEEVERLYLGCVEHLDRRGLRQYEVSNFARPGAESRHNQAYWLGRPYLGLGPSASGFWGRRRYTNERHLARYLERVERDELPEAEVDRLDRGARRLEAVILPLRTVAGVPLERLPDHALDLAAGRDRGWWTTSDGLLRLTARGFLRIDAIEAQVARALG
ncbi:radical SAM protein, partial [bacterium]|nr:radical SAM protein [bacterium]